MRSVEYVEGIPQKDRPVAPASRSARHGADGLGIGLCYLKDALSPARRAVRRCRVAQHAEFNAREAEFDQAYGVDTAGIVSLDTIDEVVGPNRDEGIRYEGVDPVLLRERIAALGIDFPQYTFIDLGSGNGHELLIAAQFPFRQVRGVDFTGHARHRREERRRLPRAAPLL